jgi:hypothetical protein
MDKNNVGTISLKLFHSDHSKFPFVVRNLLISAHFAESPDVASRNKAVASFHVIGIRMSKEKWGHALEGGNKEQLCVQNLSGCKSERHLGR